MKFNVFLVWIGRLAFKLYVTLTRISEYTVGARVYVRIELNVWE